MKKQTSPPPSYPRIVTSLSYSSDEARCFEHPSGVSMTVPNQVLTPKQILERFSKGLPLDTSLIQGRYYGEEEMPDFKTMDLSEIHDWHIENKEYIDSLTAELAEKEAADKAAAHELELRKKWEAELPPSSSASASE